MIKLIDEPSLDSIYTYPVKSCRGIRITHSKIDSWGLKWDRKWMLVDGNGNFLTQREYPKLAVVKPSINDEQLMLEAPDKTPLRIDKEPPTKRVKVSIWGDRVRAGEEGGEASDWFSDLIGERCRLVRRLSRHERELKQNPNRQDVTVGFADTHPFLLINKQSVETLNQYLDRPVSPDRFRANFIVNNLESFQEDYWSQIQIGEVKFDVVRSKPRCRVITVDQKSGQEDSPQPLSVLSQKRKGKEGVLFGRELVHHSPGTIKETDQITVLDRRSSVESGEGEIR